MQQYLRLIGKEREAFEQDIRTEAEVRVRRSLALDAFAAAENLGARADQRSDDEAEARSTRALARLVELATGDGRNGGGAGAGVENTEKTAEREQTSDTGLQTPDADEPTSALEEDRGTA